MAYCRCYLNSLSTQVILMVSFIRITKYHFIQVPCIRQIDATLFLRLYDRYMLLYYQYHASMLHETYNCKYMELITGLRVVALITNRFISNLCILVFWTVSNLCICVNYTFRHPRHNCSTVFSALCS